MVACLDSKFSHRLSFHAAHPITDFESSPVDSKGLPTTDDKNQAHTVPVSDATVSDDQDEARRPTEDELATLPLVAAALPWRTPVTRSLFTPSDLLTLRSIPAAVAMCLIEFAERASCTSVLCKARLAIAHLPSQTTDLSGPSVIS